MNPVTPIALVGLSQYFAEEQSTVVRWFKRRDFMGGTE